MFGVKRGCDVGSSGMGNGGRSGVEASHLSVFLGPIRLFSRGVDAQSKAFSWRK